MSKTATREPQIIDLNTFRPGDPVRPGESVPQAIARKRIEAQEMERARLERELDTFEKYLDGLPKPPELAKLSKREREMAEVRARLDYVEDRQHNTLNTRLPGQTSDSPYSWSNEQRLLNELDRRRRREWLEEKETREREDGTTARRNAYDEKTRTIVAHMHKTWIDADSARDAARNAAIERKDRELAELGERP